MSLLEKDLSILNDSVPEIHLCLPDMKSEIVRVQRECSERGLLQTAKWLAEINYTLRDVSGSGSTSTSSGGDGGDSDSYIMAKSYFDLKEYDRAAFFTSDLTSHKAEIVSSIIILSFYLNLQPCC